jgi:hypothetical protein
MGIVEVEVTMPHDVLIELNPQKPYAGYVYIDDKQLAVTKLSIDVFDPDKQLTVVNFSLFARSLKIVPPKDDSKFAEKFKGPFESKVEPSVLADSVHLTKRL